MVRAVWFFIQLVAIIAVSVWIIERPGQIVVRFSDYTVTAQLGAGLLVLAVLVLTSLLVYRVLRSIVDFPIFLKRRSDEATRKKGFQALTRGFVAIAAGNAKDANNYARQTKRLLTGETGLPLLLEAQAARLRGDEGKARLIFTELLKDKDAAFFGVRGLLKSALDAQDYETALDHARRALALNPKQPWILRMVYELELHTRRWKAAQATAKKIVRYKAMDPAQVKSNEIAILLHRARQSELNGEKNDALNYIRKAYKLDKFFIPTVLAELKHVMEQGKTRKAKSILQKAWKHSPHPDLLPYWEELAPQNTKRDPMKKLKYYEKILALKPESVEGQLAVARAAIDQSLWGEAKAYLAAAEKIYPVADIYRLRAEIEKRTTKNEEVVHNYLEKASEAPAGKVWYCKKTGHIYDRWSAVAEPHGTFNTIEWGYPQIGVPMAAIQQMDMLMFEASAA
jgi:HemY protein